MQNKVYILRLPVLLFIALSGFLIQCQWNLEPLEFLELETVSYTFIDNSTIEVEASIQGLNRNKVDQHGYLWSSQTNQPNFRIREGILLLGEKENGTYTVQMNNLNPGTAYFMRPFAQIDEREFYGEIVEVMTGQLSINTGEIAYVAGTEALISGKLNGVSIQSNIVDYGHVWSNTESIPTLFNGTFTRFGKPASDQSFTSTINNLQDNTSIFVRAYALYNFGLDTLYGQISAQDISLTDYWRPRSSIPSSTGIAASSHFVLDGIAYVFHGVYHDYHPTNSVYAFNPKLNLWTQKNDLPQPPSFGAVAFQLNGIGYAGDISNNERIIYQYDPQLDQWSEKTVFPGEPRNLVQTFDFSDKIFVLGGVRFESNGTYTPNDIWQYDPVQNQWTQLQEPPFVLQYGTIGLAIEDKGYVLNASGKGEVRIPVNQVWEFDPATLTWDYVGLFPDGQIESGATFALNDKGYLIGGLSLGFLFTQIFWEFDPAQRTWLRKSDFPGPERRFAFGFSINNKGYLGGGDTHTGRLQDFWEYIPANE